MIAIFLLTGCSVFSPIKTQSHDTYVLSEIPKPLVKHPTRSLTLLVNYPQSSAMYNTTQMAYSTQTFKIAYYSKNEWADTPSHMLQPLIVRTLQNTHYFRDVLSPGMLGQYQIVLNTQLVKMQQVFFNHTSEVRIIINAQLIDTIHNNRLIATKEFSVNEMAYPTPYGGVIAANRGVAKLLAQLAEFVTSQHSI